MTEFPQLDSCLDVPVFTQGDDPIACLNKAMAFLSAVAASRFPLTNNQLRTSSNLRNQATIQDGRVIVQQVQGRQGQSYASTGYKGNVTSSKGNNVGGQHMNSGHKLDEEQLAFFADSGILDGQATQTIIPNNATFQTEDLDAYDTDCDDVSTTQAVLMANLSNYGSDIISEMEVVVQQCSVDKQCFEIHKKELFLENDRLLHQIMSQDVMLYVMNSTAVFGDLWNMNWQSKYFENNNLKAQLQAKDTTISKLKEHIRSMRENDKEEKVKQEMDENETINIKLEHSVAKLLFENELLHKEIEHLKNIYKDQFDSIKKTRTLSKEHCDSLIAQLNSKSMENAYLKSVKFKKMFCDIKDILQGIVELAKAKQPLDDVLDFACFPDCSLVSRLWMLKTYNWRTQKIMETIHVMFDELTSMAFEQFISGSGLQFMTPGTSNSGLVLKNPKTHTFMMIHFMKLFMKTSQGSSSNVRPSYTPFELLGKWTKNHPIANVIGDPSRSVSTRNQLQTDAMW
ncbi:hypothetical protein Tco_0841889 [Tanacetum coccineum]|uniref:Uncharacterized protein n=1 Tax=Tanacetum coccineum TaxID=301880 RepID=A0ABQ5AZZ8_9ASTR